MKRFLVGRNVSLHGLEPKHLAEDQPYFSWLDDLSTDIHTERSRFPNTQKRMMAYYEKACRNEDLVVLGIFENASDRHIGNVTLKDVNTYSRRAWLGYMIGERDARGKGHATEAVLMMMFYGFKKLNLNRIHTTITDTNLPSLKVAERVGLVREGTLREHIITGSTRHDVFAFGALADEWLESMSGTIAEIMPNHDAI